MAITFRVRPPAPPQRQRALPRPDRWTPFEKPIARAFVGAVTAHQRNINEEALISAVARYDLSSIIEALGFGALDSRLHILLTAPLLAAYESGAEYAKTKITAATGVRLAKAELSATFGVTNTLATKAAQEQVGLLITNISSDQLRMIRDLLAQRGFEGGLPVRSIAKMIAGVVGLNERQAIALDRYIAAQYASLLERYKGNIPQRQIDLMQNRADRYEERLLRQRGEMIARTETISAGITGQLDLWKEGQAGGWVAPDAEKVWVVTADDVTCEECLAMEDEQVPIEETFSDGSDGPPAHPACRCDLGLAAPQEQQAEDQAPADESAGFAPLDDQGEEPTPAEAEQMAAMADESAADGQSLRDELGRMFDSAVISQEERQAAEALLDKGKLPKLLGGNDAPAYKTERLDDGKVALRNIVTDTVRPSHVFANEAGAVNFGHYRGWSVDGQHAETKFGPGNRKRGGGEEPARPEPPKPEPGAERTIEEIQRSTGLSEIEFSTYMDRIIGDPNMMTDASVAQASKEDAVKTLQSAGVSIEEIAHMARYLSADDPDLLANLPRAVADVLRSEASGGVEVGVPPERLGDLAKLQETVSPFLSSERAADLWSEKYAAYERLRAAGLDDAAIVRAMVGDGKGAGHTSDAVMSAAHLISAQREGGHLAEAAISKMPFDQLLKINDEVQAAKLAPEMNPEHLADVSKLPEFIREEAQRAADLFARDGGFLPITSGTISEYQRPDGKLTAKAEEHLKVLTDAGKAVEREARKLESEARDRQGAIREEIRQVAEERGRMSIAERLNNEGRAAELLDRMKALDKGLQAAERSERQAAFSVLERVRAMGEKVKVESSNNAAGKRMVENAQKHYPKAWIDRANNKGGARIKTENRRPFANGRDLHLQSKEDEGARSTVVHELGHYMESFGGVNVTHSEYLFMHDRMAPDEQAVRLSALTGNMRYDHAGEYGVPPEMAIKDDFSYPYSGKDYQRESGTPSGGAPESHYELLTTGMEQLYGQRQDVLDPGYRYWLLGVLALL